MSASSPSPSPSFSDQHRLIDKHQVFKIQGRDRRGRLVLLVVGKFFPARAVSSEALRSYLEAKIFPSLCGRPFCVVYLHTGVQRSENFPGFSTLRSACDALPAGVRDSLDAVYFVHPGLQARLCLATFGRILFSGGLYLKMKYVRRLEFLWEHVRRKEVELPEFVYDHDEELEGECRPVTDYGPESDHPRFYDASPTVDSPVSMYSMRCIA